MNDRRFARGSSIFLKRGDVWRQELSLRGSGSPTSMNQLGAYGSGARPLILREDKDFDRCIVLNNASFWRVADVECRNACLGIFLRYFESVGYQGITVENCHFADLDSWAIDPQVHSMEWAVPAAIWVGGIIKSGDEYATVLDGLTIRNCGMENCTAGIGTGYYYPPSQPARVTHLTIEDSYATHVTIGGLSCDSVSQAVVRRFRTFERHGRPGGIWTGSTGVMLSTCADFLFEDCEFSETDRAWSDPSQGDGCGFDFERSAARVTFRRCLFHDNDGPGILTLSTAGGVANTNLLIQDSTFWNDALDPQDATYSPGGNAYEIKFSSGTAYGTVTNCGFYRSVTASNWFYPSPMTSAIKLLNNRTLRWTNFMTLPGTPVWEWNTNGNFEGWTNRNQWLSPAVYGGEFSGTAQGNDPYAYSPKLWVNTLRASPYFIEILHRDDHSVHAVVLLAIVHVKENARVTGARGRAAFAEAVRIEDVCSVRLELAQAEPEIATLQRGRGSELTEPGWSGSIGRSSENGELWLAGWELVGRNFCYACGERSVARLRKDWPGGRLQSQV